MQTHRASYISLILFLTIPLCANVNELKRAITGKILEKGTITCFEENLKDPRGKTIPAAPSAVVYNGTHLIFANDKPIHGEEYSAVFAFNYTTNHTKKPAKASMGAMGIIQSYLYPQRKAAESTSVNFSAKPSTYFTHTPFIGAKKYESATITPDGKYTILATGFSTAGYDIFKADHPFNTMLIFPSDTPEKVKIACEHVHEGVRSSLPLRDRIKDALKTPAFPKGPPYVNIEGLAAIPGNKLLFGVRQIGTCYDQFEYVIKILSTDYEIVDGELILGETFELVYDYDVERSEPGLLTELFCPLGISSLEYDKFNDRLVMLTSCETLSGMNCSYVWILTMEDFKKKLPPQLVLNKKGKPLCFKNKMEGLAIIDKETIFVVADDDHLDQALPTHPVNEAAYAFVRISN